MNVIEKMRLNRFRYVSIPTNRDLYREFHPTEGKCSFNPDEIQDVSVGRKTEVMQDAINEAYYNAEKQAEIIARNKREAEEKTKNKPEDEKKSEE